jgi:signal transduction histidine kinase
MINTINAIERDNGAVTVRTSIDSAANQVTLTIGDNGPGIPQDVASKIFEAFYSTKGHGGTGLGLAVAKKIVDEHGGKIEVQSAPGEGTLIRVKLPIHSPTGVDSAETHGPAMPR